MAALHGRKVAFVGRSMVRNMGIARDLGYLRIPGGMLVGVRRPAEPARRRDRADLHRLAGRADGGALAHGQPRPRDQRRAGDTVVLASSLIPGNENSVFRVINGLARLGAHIVHKGNALVHVSGHAAAGELCTSTTSSSRATCMPVHGEWRHMRANAEIATSVGVARERVVLAEDGDGRWTWSTARRRSSATCPCGFVYVDGLGRRRRHRDVAEGPARPRRGGLHLDLRRRRHRRREDRGGTGDPCPRLRRGRKTSIGAAAGPGDAGASRPRWPTASTTRTSSSSGSAARWASGSTRHHRRRPMIIPVVVEA